MNFRNLKFTSKLAICSAVFLLPLGIMLFTIITNSLASISKDRRELEGIEILRPAISLMQVIPQYIRVSIDNAPDDIEFVKQYSSNLFTELNDKRYEYYNWNTDSATIRELGETWERMTITRNRSTILFTYNQLMKELANFIYHIGDTSGLIVDANLENIYIIMAAVHELPRAQERMVSITSSLRTIEDGAFTQRRREELRLDLDLLNYSDNERIMQRFNYIRASDIQSAADFDSFDLLLKACYDRIEYFSLAAESFVRNDLQNSNYDLNSISALYEAFNHANNAAFRLQSASFDRLESAIKNRIKQNMQHFIVSLITTLAAAILAFTFLISTVLSMRKSTDGIGKVFRRLDNNDLSVQVKSFSRDEIGELMTSLGGFLKKINSDFLSFSSNAKMVSTAVQELSSSTQEITATANEQSANIGEIVSIMESNKELASQSSEKTVEVAQLAAQTQDLSRRGATLSEINEDMMADIQDQNHKIIEIIKNLVDMLSRIDESIQLIDTIADRTKLIAFNAALEASSSGEVGGRFSVVSGEIRRFADNVVESVTEIKEKISELNEASQMLIAEANKGTLAISSGYNRMLEQKEVFENIVDISQNVASRSQQISGLSKQQEMASTHVFVALKEISSGVNQFVSATTMTLASVEKLNGMSIELKETLDKYHTTERSEV